MLAVHIGPTRLTDTGGRIYAELTHGRASILFTLLAGVGVSLLARSRSATLLEMRIRLVWQSLVLLPLGLWLQGLDITILVVLAHYAMLFLLGAICATWGMRTLTALAAFACVVGPSAFQAGRNSAPEVFNRAPVQLGDPLAEIVHTLALSGPYPLLTWAGPFLIGMLVGRLDLRGPRVQAALALTGLGTALAAAGVSLLLEFLLGPPEGGTGWLRLIDDAPHSQTPLWIAGAAGSALFALGVSLFLADRYPQLVWPLVATGQLALTVYVGHVLAFHWIGSDLRSPTVAGALPRLAAILAAAIAFACLWRSLLPRGPLESVLALPAIIARHRRRRASGSPAGQVRDTSSP